MPSSITPLSFIEGVVSNCMRTPPGLFSFLLCPSPSLARMGITNWCPLLFFLSILWLCRWLEGALFCRSFRTWNLALPRIIPFSRSYCLSLIAFLLYPWLFVPFYLGISLQPATAESLFVISRIFGRSPLLFFRCKVRLHRCVPSTSRLSLFLLKITAAFRIFLLNGTPITKCGFPWFFL